MDLPTAEAKQGLLRFSNPAGLYDPTPSGYSHLAEVAPNARLILAAGQGGEDADMVFDPDFRTQTRQCLKNVATALTAADAKPTDIARLLVLIVDYDESLLRIYVEELARVFGPEVKPACTLIPVPRLALDGMLIEIEATAVVAP